MHELPFRGALADPVVFAQAFCGLELHVGQQKWLRHSVAAENLLHTGNRWGKSLVQAVKFLHRCLFKIRPLRYAGIDRYEAVNASITLDQANIIFGHAVALIKKNPVFGYLVDEIKYSPFPQIRFSNGATMWARSTQRRGEFLLGHDYDYFNFDEAAFETHADYVVNEVIKMRLADRDGRLDYTSTPCGKNWFYRKMQQLQKEPDFGYVQRGDSRENPYISREYLARRVEELSADYLAQNIEGRFVDIGDEVITEEQIQRALMQATGLAEPAPHHVYVHGWDLARKRTFTAGMTLDISVTPWQMVAFERFQHRDWPLVYAAIRARHRRYGGRTIIDATGLGDVVLSEVQDIGAEGFNFGERGGKAKAELIANLQQSFAAGRVGIVPVEQTGPSGEHWSLLGELREFTWENNQHCDAVFALALALWAMRTGEIVHPPAIFRLESL